MHGTIDDEAVLDERPKVGVVEREQAIDAGAHRAGDDSSLPESPGAKGH